MVDIIEESSEVKFHYIMQVAYLHHSVGFWYSIFYRPVRAETIAVFVELGFAYGAHDLFYALLYQSVPYGRGYR